MERAGRANFVSHQVQRRLRFDLFLHQQHHPPTTTPQIVVTTPPSPPVVASDSRPRTTSSKMGNKRKHETLADVLARPWCYYCERDFDNVKVLVDHQKARHFQCHIGTCHRRLNTVGGLKVHMAQVHKAELHEAPNAIDRRKGLDIEIFGMVGVPDSLINSRNDVVRRAYENMEAEHVARTGNPLPGSDAAKVRNEEAREAKKPKVDSKEELKRRVAEAKAKAAARKAAAAAGLPPPSDSSTPPAAVTPQNNQAFNVQNTPTPPAMPAYAAPPPPSIPSPMTGLPPGFQPPFPFGMPPGYDTRTLPHGMPPPLGVGSSASSSAQPMAADLSIYREPVPQISNSSARTSPNDNTPQRGGVPLSNQFDTKDGSVSLPSSHPASVMTPAEIDSGINTLWGMMEKQKAAGVANPQIIGVSPPDPTPVPKDRTKEKAAGKQAQHSKLQIRDNHVSPEEKRARADRYQPKPKTSTMPTATPTQGVTGAVDA